MMCGTVSPLAAQELSATNATVAVDTDAETLASGAFGQAGAPPTPEHTGIKAMFKGLGDDVAHLPSRHRNGPSRQSLSQTERDDASPTTNPLLDKIKGDSSVKAFLEVFQGEITDVKDLK
jgi:hypothetical protein